MVRITIELVRHGNECQKKTIGVLEIANNGDGSFSEASYKVVRMYETGNQVLDITSKKIQRNVDVFVWLMDVLRNIFKKD